MNDNSSKTTTQDLIMTRDQEQESKIKHLELELARVKLELVDAQCRNQEFDHKLKSVLNINLSSQDSSNESNTQQQVASKSLSQSSLTNGESPTGSNPGLGNFYQTQANTNSNYSSMSNSNNSVFTTASNNGTNSTTNSNNWLSKTLFQFKEATNQVVQKAQKVKLNSNDSNNFVK